MSERLPWQEELAIIDKTMKAISSITDPEDLVDTYWKGIGKLVPANDYLALSRRNVSPPWYVITRSSRFTEHHNPFTHRERLPHLQGGVLGEIAYANGPVIIDDLPKRLKADDPAHFYLEGFESLVALPQYDGGEGLNVTLMLSPPGRKLDASFIPMMHWQAGLFGRGTHNLVLRNQLTAMLETLDAELKVVGNIQRSLLPHALPKIEGFEVAAYYNTSAQAGGDYYDFFPLPGDGCGIFIADVSGHGTPAAVLMAITHAIAHTQPGTHTPPARLLTYLNDHLKRSYTRNGTFVTAFYAVLDPARKSLVYSSAGHNPPRLVRGDRVIALDQHGSLPLGIEANEQYGEAQVTLECGDLLLLYTDGITETPAPSPKRSSAAMPRQLLGVERLDTLLRQCREESAEGCIARIRSAVDVFSGNTPPTDDQTLIALRC